MNDGDAHSCASDTLRMRDILPNDVERNHNRSDIQAHSSGTGIAPFSGGSRRQSPARRLETNTELLNGGKMKLKKKRLMRGRGACAEIGLRRSLLLGCIGLLLVGAPSVVEARMDPDLKTRGQLLMAPLDSLPTDRTPPTIDQCKPARDAQCILPGGGNGGGGVDITPVEECYPTMVDQECTPGEPMPDGEVCICGQAKEDGGTDHMLYWFCKELGDELIPGLGDLLKPLEIDDRIPDIVQDFPLSNCEAICGAIPDLPPGLEELAGETCNEVCGHLCENNPGCVNLDPISILVDAHCCELATQEVVPWSECFDQETHPLNPSPACCSPNKENGWLQQCLECCDQETDLALCKQKCESQHVRSCPTY